MKRLFTFWLSALLAIIVAAAPAPAQKFPASAIGVLDVQRLLRDSAAAKSIEQQIERLRKGFQRDVRERESVLRKADQELLEQRAILAPEAFAKRRRQFEKRANKAQREVQTRKRAIDRAHAVARRKIRISVLRIAEDVATEKKINIVIFRSAVLISTNDLEITAETMKRLNQQLPTVEVEFPEKK